MAAALLVGLAGACATAPDLASLEATARRLDEAARAGDRAALERLVAVDFLQIRGGGAPVDRARYVGDLVAAVAADPAASSYESTIDAIRLDGRFGVVAGALRYPRPGRTDVHARYANAYAWRDGRWQVWFEQLAVVPSAPP